MKKNVSGQKVGCQMVSATDGSAFTGSVTVYVTGDAGTQAAGSVGSGACTHEGNGYHTYAPAQAETNYDLIAFTFTGTGAVPVTVQVYPLPTTGILAPTTADRTLDVSATGEAGIDWANVGSQSTSVNLSATTVNLVNTATTVTNQLTAAQIATGVWQDSTAGDFTTASSIGKALYINNVAPGGSGGHLISGSNSGTTTLAALTITGATTHTGNVSMAAGLNITQSSSNTSALVVTGNGTGHGIAVTSGSGATGDGIRSTAASTNGNAMNLVGVGTGAGLLSTGGATGHGISGVGGATSGNGMRLAGTAGNSIAFNMLGQGSAAGMSCTGGATGAGASFVGGATSGNAISTSVTSGNLYINANVTHYSGTAGTFASGRPEVNTTHIAGSSVSTSSAQIGVNVVNAGGTAWASGSLTSGVFAAGAINAAAIATDAIDADALAADAIAEINATVDTALADINLDHLVKNAVDTDFPTTVHLDSVIGYLADNGTTATFDRTTDSLEVLGAATAPSAASIADAVWDEALSGHLTSGSTGEALNAAGSAGDPWTTTLPGSYTGSQAGKMLSDILVDTGTTLQGELDGIQADTEDIQSRLPAALVGGRIDATVDATGMESGAVGAIVAGVWGADATSYQTQGTFGQVLGDTGAGGSSIYDTVSTNLPVDLSGVPADTASAVWQDLTANHTDAGTYGLALGTTLQANLNTVDTVVDAIKVKTDYLPSATAGASGGVFIAGSNAATTVNITGNITGNLSGSVGSVTATVSADTVSISGDSTAADNLESYLDGTNFMPVDAHKPIFSISGATLTVKKPDGTTTAYTRTLTTDAAADPVTGSS